MPLSTIKEKISNIGPKKLSEEEQVSEMLADVEEKEIQRPFNALVNMSSEQRNNIRLTLDFKWDDETKAASEKNKDKFEAYEILNCNIKGIVSRIHSIKEQVNPFNFNGWRKTLVRVLDLSGIHFNASDSESVLEKLILETLEDTKRLSKKRDASLSLGSAAKLGKSVGIAASILKDVGTMWDDVLGSEDEPAINAIYAICVFLHKESE